jgi:hypothetical protein
VEPAKIEKVLKKESTLPPPHEEVMELLQISKTFDRVGEELPIPKNYWIQISETGRQPGSV